MIIVRLLSPGPFGWLAPPKFTRVQGADIVMESITLKHPLPCRRNLLRVLELVLLQPTTCDLRQSFVPKLVPALFQAESSDCTPECTKGSRSVNSIQQLAPD